MCRPGWRERGVEVLLAYIVIAYRINIICVNKLLG